MNKKLKFLIGLGTFGLTALTISPFMVTSCASNDSNRNVIHRDIKVISTNDIHGRMLVKDKNGVVQEAGIEQISGWLKTQDYDLLLDGGDMIQGTALNDNDKGHTIAKIADIMGYDAIAVGNHEFDFGLENLLEITQKVNNRFLSSNVRYMGKSKRRVFTATRIKEIRPGFKVGIIGLTTPETAYKTHPKNVKDVYFSDMIRETKIEVRRLENQGINFIAMVTHVGEYKTIPLAEAIPNKIDLIIDGHSQIDFNARIGNTYIIQTGEYTEAVRRTKFDFNQATGLIQNFDSQLVPASEICRAANKIDERIAKLVDNAESLLEIEFGQIVLKNLPYKLEGERNIVRYNQTNLGDLTADAMVWSAQTSIPSTEPIKTIDFAITNSGGIRASINPGPVTRKNTYTVFPFGNRLSIVKAKGSTVKKIFDFSVSKRGDGALLQVSKEVKMVQNADSTWTYTINNQPIDDQKVYLFATNDFIAAGGDGYDMIKTEATPVFEGSDFKDSFEEYLMHLDKQPNGIGFEPYKLPTPVDRISFYSSPVYYDLDSYVMSHNHQHNH